jgi:hypothetical protein
LLPIFFTTFGRLRNSTVIFIALCHERRGLPFRRLEPFGRFPALLQADVPGFNQVDGFGVTEANTLRIAVAEITFDYLAIRGYEMHGAERTHRNAGAAADAFIVVYLHPPRVLIPGKGLGRTGDCAGGVLALLAGHRNIDSFSFPFDNPDAATSGIGHVVMLHGADEFAQPAPGALIVICP